MAVESNKAEKTFDIKKARNDVGFLKFLGDTEAGKDGSLSMSDTETIERLHSAYESQKPVAKKIVEAWKATAFAETNSKLNVDAAQQALLVDHVMKLAASNPDEFLKLQTQVEHLSIIPQHCEATRKQLAELVPGIDLTHAGDIEGNYGAKVAELEEKQALLASARKRSWWEAGKHDEAAVAEVQKRYGIKRADVAEKLEEIEAELEQLSDSSGDIAKLVERAKKHQGALDALKSGLVDNIPELKAIHDDMAAQVIAKLGPLVGSAKRADQQKAFEQLSHLEKLTGRGRDYLPGIDIDLEKTKLDVELGQKFTDEIVAIVRDGKLGSYDQLYSKLKPLIEVKAVGSRDGKGCRAILLEELEKFRDGTTAFSGTDAAARRLVVDALYAELK
ncbi:MAG: hypothetical protein Q7R93_04585 [bacterium]|nr:hypothetical protein [bacterium]